MKIRIEKWETDLVIRIPEPLAEQASITPETQVEIKLVDSILVISSDPIKEYRLENLLAGITEDNLHEETDWGSVQRKEAG